MLKHVLSEAAPFVPLVVAQANNGFNGNQLLVWLGIAVFLIVMLNAAIDLWNKLTGGLKETPPPRDTYSTQVACALTHKALDEKLAAMKRDDEEHRKTVRIDLKGIHERINQVAGNNSELLGLIKAKLS